MMLIDRRKFLTAMLSAAVAAPAIVRASSLMKVRFIDILDEDVKLLGYGRYEFTPSNVGLLESIRQTKMMVAARVLNGTWIE